MQPLELKQSIVQTLAFFAIFDVVLTKEEVTQYLWRGGNVTRKNVEQALQELVQEEKIILERGYFALTKGLTSKRIERIALIEHKMKIAHTAAKWLRYVPFIQAVFVCNNLALEAVSKGSDVDVCIVVTSGRIWTARFLATMLLRLRGIARTKRKSIDKVCLSFYVTDSALNFSHITITNPDIYLMYWIRSLIPLYDRVGVYETLQRKNSWVDTYIKPQYTFRPSTTWRVEPTKLSRTILRLFETMWKEKYGERIESEAKKIQEIKMKFRESVREADDTRVIVSDEMLKFHENDRRVQYAKEWKNIAQKSL